MHGSYHNIPRRSLSLIVSIAIATLSVGVSVAFASLVFNGTSITGDSNSTLDATGTITIGATQTTGITVGHSGITATFPGTVSITGTTTTLQDLVVSGACTGCASFVGTTGYLPIWNASGTGLTSTSSLYSQQNADLSVNTTTDLGTFGINGTTYLNGPVTLSMQSGAALKSVYSGSSTVYTLLSVQPTSTGETTGPFAITFGNTLFNNTQDPSMYSAYNMNQ